ncbi:MAG: hypothetical protein ACOCP8_00215 [archaeon]
MNTEVKVMTKEEWEKFIKADVMNFMAANNLEKIQVCDGAGKKGDIKRNNNGEFKLKITAEETL